MDEKVDKILELVGVKALEESLAFLNVGGIICNTGVLGGEMLLNNFDPIKQIPNGVYLSSFYSNYPTQDEIDEMMDFIDRYAINPIIGNVYLFEEIAKAHEDLEKGNTNGKAIVVVDDELKQSIKKLDTMNKIISEEY